MATDKRCCRENRYIKGDDDADGAMERERIEWQSLQSYNVGDWREAREDRGEWSDGECDGGGAQGPRRSERPETAETAAGIAEPGDIGCTDQWLHGQLQQMAVLLMQGTEDFMRKVWRRGWGLVQHQHLPAWLKDNNFLVRNHRPELQSFAKCFRSIFRVHTETVNIWTHLLGWLGFLAIAAVLLWQPGSGRVGAARLHWQDTAILMCFFLGAILCLGFSWLFHTVYCHSQTVGTIFNKLDYCGIALLTVGSFIPWLYYSFYCSFIPKIVYLSLILALGALALVVSMFDRFATPPYRPLRAGVFIGLGLSGVVPCLHNIINEGFTSAIYHSSVGWLSLMALLYITGAVIYAARIPERLLPGRFDIIFQSHQIFHIFVVTAALVHYYGIALMMQYRMAKGDCSGPVSLVVSRASASL